MPGSAEHYLESLPLAWLTQFVGHLPVHLRLKLRQCSRMMQQLVDASGVHLKLCSRESGSVALQLCRHELASLDITGIPSSFEATGTAAAAAALAGDAMPCLARMRCDAAQIQLLVALASCSPHLTALKLSCKAPLTQHDQANWATVHQQLPGLASSLRSVEMDSACHRQFMEQPCMWPAIGACTNLEGLVLHMPKPQDYSIARCDMAEQTWQVAVQPLANLTHLEMGMRKTSGSSIGHSSRNADLAVSSPGTTAGPGCLPQLRHLRCYGFDFDCEDQSTWNLAWVGVHTRLTYLDLMFVSSGEVDFEVIGQLQQLCSLSLHCFPDELLNSSQLAPLSSCSQLTCLRVDSLLIEPGHSAAAAGLAAVDTTGGTAQLAAAATAATTSAVLPAGTAAGGTAAALPQLCSLRKLVAGVLCKAPVSSFAPNLTQLRDLDYDLAELELSSSFISERPPEGQHALAGLDGLQLLAANIHALVRHAAYPGLTQLSNLRELHIDMVGNLDNTCISAGGGLPWLQHLTRLVMTLAHKVTCNLKNTYTTEEDLLLWQNQRSVQQMRLRGSKLLGGFLVVDRLLALLPSKMPALRCIELAKCSDLTVQELSKLVDSRAAQLVVVYGCAKISERDCVELQRGAADAVVVEYAM